MFGRIDHYFGLVQSVGQSAGGTRGAVIIISVMAAATDLFKGKIYNWLTFPAMLLGLIAGAVFGGWSGAGISMLGLLVGLIGYGALFAVGVIAGGDVKLLMAVGAWSGVSATLQTGILGVLFGGVMAVLVLLARGRLFDFGKRVQRSALTVAVKDLEFEPPQLDKTSTMPFGVPIAIAAICVSLGVRLWQ